MDDKVAGNTAAPWVRVVGVIMTPLVLVYGAEFAPSKPAGTRGAGFVVGTHIN